ncbi:sn-glycerol-3-phosphate ABC transporter permease UgpE [Fluviispira multicolorata]|uniref:sn-glycerol-3-phosphate transport system permease protein UgpE n=1 Tax=Fluviispira multicolorata TaxID=2654512 RepID=A0A833JFH7_9BACT|nr:sn-glycerol-3-phosphate ABC transporter permease UgpE [Fluviispira multicolorata]KAB8030959.1 sn-glycerol-3-phosphate ABC transporter permease UgpE [Fluviispira multicolorata]
MEENQKFSTALSHFILIIGIIIITFPIYYALVTSSQSLQTVLSGKTTLLPGGNFLENYKEIFSTNKNIIQGISIWRLLLNSLIVTICITFGKTIISIMSAYAIVYFKFPFQKTAFALIFLTLMLPIEVRIVPTFQMASSLNFLDSYQGLSVPLIASATATFLFRQFFMSIPDELCEAARIDGAGPLRFFFDTILPLSKTSIAALFVILFIYGWNQYLWPLLITTKQSMGTIIIALTQMIANDGTTPWHLVMGVALIAMLPPILVVVLMQKWFVKGLIDSEK